LARGRVFSSITKKKYFMASRLAGPKGEDISGRESYGGIERNGRYYIVELTF